LGLKAFSITIFICTCIYGHLWCTIVDGGPGIMAKIFGVFGTKTCYFIKENMTKMVLWCSVLFSALSMMKS
jgi:hypothetical protein